MVSAAKISGTFILFAISFLFGLLPYFIIKCVGIRFKGSNNYKTFLSILNCFSGGVFFATTIMNLLPEALEMMEQVLDEVEKRGFNTQFKKYPITESLLGGGFFLILLIENIVAAWFVQTSTKDEVNETPCQQDSDGVKMAMETGKEIKTSTRSSDGEIKYVSEFEMETEFTKTQEISKESYQFHDFLNRTHVGPSLREAAATSSCKSSNQEDNDKNYRTITKDSKSDINFPDNEQLLAIDNNICNSSAPTRLTKLRTVILLIALSFHMLFDGLALGLQKEDSKVWKLLGALAVHRSIVSFSIGSKLVETIPSMAIVMGFLTLFSVVSPLGLIVGIGITSTNETGNLSRDLASAILQGIATGTFMYVTFFEVLFKEFPGTRDLRKAVALMVGFMVIAAVKFLDK